MDEFGAELYSINMLEDLVRDDDIAADPVFEFDISAVDTVSDPDLPVVETVDEDSSTVFTDDDSLSDCDLHHISELGQELTDIEFPTGPDRVVYEFPTVDSAVPPPVDWSAVDPDCAAAAVELAHALSDLPFGAPLSSSADSARQSPNCVLDDRPLHALKRQCKERKISVEQRYKQLHSQVKDLANVHKVGLRAHMDGGASASTTNRAEYLWGLRPINSTVRLRVADNAVYHPKAEGFLRVPVGHDQYKFVPCFYTPGIAATIISPARTCDFWRYRGVGTYVDRYDNTGNVEFRHPLRRSQDVLIPCSIFQGLLFTERLMKPTTEEMFQPLPKSALHVVEVPPAPSPATSDSDLPVQACSCCDDCAASTPGVPEVDSIAELLRRDDEKADQFLHYLRTGMQQDVLLHHLSENVDGVPAWDKTSSAHVCGPSCCRAGCCRRCSDHSSDSTSPSVAEEGSGELASVPEEGPEESASTRTVDESALATAASTAVDTPSSTASGSASGAPSPSPIQYADELDKDKDYRIHHMSRDQLLLLYHERLGHMHYNRVSATTKKSLGLPRLRVATVFDNCPVCQQAKARKANRGTESTRTRAEECAQGISIDFGFVVQRSSDSSRLSKYAGLYGQTCYCLITDHHTGMLWGDTFNSKTPPIDFLNRWLVRFGLPKDSQGKNGQGKYVCFDPGGDLGKSSAVIKLFEDAGYKIEPTAPDDSSANGLGERPHRTIKEAMRAMLSGAGLDAKYWPFAFRHFLYIYNLTPHAGRPSSPYTMFTGKKADLSHLRVFGCHVVVRDKPSGALASRSHSGSFLGFCATKRQVMYWDDGAKEVLTARHVDFDETESDSTARSPNAEILYRLRQGHDPTPVFDAKVEVPDLDVSLSPFPVTKHFDIPLRIDSANPLGLTVNDCSVLGRAYVVQMTCTPQGTSNRTFRRHFRGSYVLKVNDMPIYSAADYQAAVDSLVAAENPPPHVDVELAPLSSKAVNASEPRPSLILRPHDLHRITALNAVDEEGISPERYADIVHAVELGLADPVDYYMDVPADDAPDITELISRLQSEGMTEEEKALPKFTRTRLKQLSNWSEWDAAFKKQLETHHKDGTLGLPVLKSVALRPSADGIQPNLLRFVWSNIVKADGTRKARACCDGSKRSAPWLRQFEQTYSSCIETPCMRLFIALSAAIGYTITVADVSNAYQQSPGPKVPCFLQIDEAYQDWYRAKFGKSIDPRTHVIPMINAFQGHPAAGRLWSEMIDGILIEELGFKNTTHERNLYRGTIDGKDCLVCRQVDDLAVSSADPATSEKLIAAIGKRVTVESGGLGTLIPRKGYHSRYNGIDLYQTRDYVKVGCDTYISRLLQTYGWESVADDANCKESPPISDDMVKKLSLLVGPEEGTAEHKQQAKDAGFSYRQLLGCVNVRVRCLPRRHRIRDLLLGSFRCEAACQAL